VRYAEVEIAAGNAAGVREIFNRSLLTCKHVELWFVYIRFIKKVGGWHGRWSASNARLRRVKQAATSDASYRSGGVALPVCLLRRRREPTILNPNRSMRTVDQRV